MVFLLLILAALISVSPAVLKAEISPVQIRNVQSIPLDGPLHHGLLIMTDGVKDPNLSFYEVQLKPDTGQRFPPYKIYSTQLKPFDSKNITIPYRNGTLALKDNQNYCVRVRGIYGEQASPWSERCGVRLLVPRTAHGDMDGDGLDDDREYALGTDPRDWDSDGDRVSDFTELTDGSDPNEALFAKLLVRSPVIDFGDGDPFGRRANQHQWIEIENVGESPARIFSVRVQDGDIRGSSGSFILANPPELLDHVPPRNILRLPISFLPKQRGLVQASVLIDANQEEPIEFVNLKGTGIEIPDCNVGPYDGIDFGTVAVADQTVSVKYITISNQNFLGPDIPDNLDTALGFTLTSSVDGIVPGISGLVVPAGKEVRIPVLFQHLEPGLYQGQITVRSAYCGVQAIPVRGVAE